MEKVRHLKEYENLLSPQFVIHIVLLIFRIGSDHQVEYKCSKFHTWFHRGVAQWLDIALYKALKRIKKAVELGNLKPIDDNVKFSSSAVDTLTIFYQIKIFWKELNWPDIESSFTFVTKIIDVSLNDLA
jgi:BAI1-associated protein 3